MTPRSHLAPVTVLAFSALALGYDPQPNPGGHLSAEHLDLQERQALAAVDAPDQRLMALEWTVSHHNAVAVRKLLHHAGAHRHHVIGVVGKRADPGNFLVRQRYELLAHTEHPGQLRHAGQRLMQILHLRGIHDEITRKEYFGAGFPLTADLHLGLVPGCETVDKQAAWYHAPQ